MNEKLKLELRVHHALYINLLGWRIFIIFLSLACSDNERNIFYRQGIANITGCKSVRNKIKILKNVNGIIKPSRFTHNNASVHDVSQRFWSVLISATRSNQLMINIYGSSYINSLSMQDDSLAWSSRLWEDHFITGTYSEAWPVLEGLLLVHKNPCHKTSIWTISVKLSPTMRMNWEIMNENNDEIKNC